MVSILMEEHTGKHGWKDTKEGFIYHTKMLKIYPTGKRELLKNSEMGSHNSGSMNDGLKISKLNKEVSAKV